MKIALLLAAAALCPWVQADEASEYEVAIRALEMQLKDVELRVKERNRKLSQDNEVAEPAQEKNGEFTDEQFAKYTDLVKFSDWGKTWWPYFGGSFIGISLILLFGAVGDGADWWGDQNKVTWTSRFPFGAIRTVAAYIRETDTLKQLCPYNPWTDPGQAPSPNPYRLVAIVGPWGRSGYEAQNLGGFKWTLPSLPGYVGIILMTTLTFIMQMYFPWKLVTGKLHGTSFVFQGLKTIFYYKNHESAVFLDLVPLSVMSAKFFVQVEDKVRSEFNQCLYLWRHTMATETSTQGEYKGIPHRAWSWFWIAVSLGINTYIAVLMTFYVVLSITTQSGDLMGFILSIFGSLGMIDFDDALLGALPEWTMWYQEHTNAAGHPQGGHWAGATADFFGGPESIKAEGDATEEGGTRINDLVRYGPCNEDSVPERYNEWGADKQRAYWRRPKYVRVGIQLTNERPNLGFLYRGNMITSVSDSGAASRAVSMWSVDKAREEQVSWQDSHSKNSIRKSEQAGDSQKGRPGLSALGQPTEREGLKKVKHQDETLGALDFGNYYGKRFPFLYAGKDFDYKRLEYTPEIEKGSPPSPVEIKGGDCVVHIKHNSNFDIGSSPVVKGSDVKKMLKDRPWQNKPAHAKEQDVIEEADKNADYVLRGTGLEAGMCIWKINDKNVATADQIKEELRALKGNCLNEDTMQFDPSLQIPEPGQKYADTFEKFDNVQWNVKEFTMTLSVAGDEDSDLDDLFHSIFYTLIRILLFGSLMFIFMVYVTDEKGNHVGI